MTVHAAWSIMKRILLETGLRVPYRACHALRRTFATRYLEARPGDLMGLKDLMRHQSVLTTEKYVFLDAADLRRRLQDVRL